MLNLFSFRVLRIVVLAVLAWGLVAWAAAEALNVHASLDHADAIVVLSGSSTYVERTTKAAELYHQGRAPLVLLTNDNTRGGWSSALQRNPYFVERARDALVDEGVPADRIRIVPGLVSSTHDEASAIKDYAMTQGLRSVLVVTSTYHSRRALRTLRQTFAGTGMAVGLETAPVGSQTPSPAFWWLRVDGWRSVGSEYPKLVYYWFKYS